MPRRTPRRRRRQNFECPNLIHFVAHMTLRMIHAENELRRTNALRGIAYPLTFQVHAAGTDVGIVLRRKLSRGQVLAFFPELPSCTVAMEACCDRSLLVSFDYDSAATVRFETAPGHQMQIDFGDTKVWSGGERVRNHLFVGTLGYARQCMLARHSGSPRQTGLNACKPSPAVRRGSGRSADRECESPSRAS